MSAANSARQVCVKLHRYVGLALAPFIIIIAATGSIITFYDELERVVNHRLRIVEPQQTAWTVPDLLAIREELEAKDPRAHVFSLQFPQGPDESLFSRVQGAIDPATGEPFALDYNQVFADPYTGERLGDRFMGNFSLQPEDLISQIYFLHYALVMPEMLGALVIGLLGLIWLFDCFVGFYLTLPPSPGGAKRTADAGRKSFLTRWKTAWQIKRGAGGNRMVYDMHRATSLWLWVMLAGFALTGFALNVPSWYARALSQVTDYTHLQEMPPGPSLEQPLIDPPVDWNTALALGQRYLAEQAQRQGFEVEQPAGIEYRRDLGMYFYLAHTSLDLRDGKTPTETDSPATAATVAIDARDGRFLGVQVPTGLRASNTITNWLLALHVTAVFGLPWQIAVSIFGLVVVAITVTGVLIWWRKRRSKSRAREPRNASAGAKGVAPEQPA